MKTDRLGRTVALQLAAGRVAVGVGASFATRPTLRVLGFDDAGAGGEALTRMLGARDLALAGATIAAREDRAALRATTLAAAALDTGDAIAFLIALRDPRTRRAGLSGVASAGLAAAAGFWAARRLR
jgi:hypothetical protein